MTVNLKIDAGLNFSQIQQNAIIKKLHSGIGKGGLACVENEQFTSSAIIPARTFETRWLDVNVLGMNKMTVVPSYGSYYGSSQRVKDNRRAITTACNFGTRLLVTSGLGKGDATS